MCFNTTAILGAMRFGLMPSVKKNFNGASSHTAMVEQANAKTVCSRDPSGFTAVDVLSGGSLATIISAGEILAGQVPYYSTSPLGVRGIDDAIFVIVTREV